jgi:hypothetical protein
LQIGKLTATTIRFRSSAPEASGTTFEVFLPVGGLTPRTCHDEDE